MGKSNKRVLNLSFVMKNSYSKKMKRFFKNALMFLGVGSFGYGRLFEQLHEAVGVCDPIL